MNHSLDQQWTCVCSPGFEKKSSDWTEGGGEVIWGEENSWLLFLSRFSSFGITDLFQTFFPPSAKAGADGNAALCLPECSQCIRFPVQRARAGKQKQTGSEGRGKWEVTEVRAWRAQMGNGGENACWGGMWWDESHTWFLLLWLLCFSCLTLLCNHDQYKV